jgi:prepilin-type N-terminal cleavage/methylation domain-containing protein
MLIWLNKLFGKRNEHGFTLIELLIVVLIVGILAAVATPIYLGYIKDAKTAEGKAIAGSIWTAVQSNGIGSCGVASVVSTSFPKAGLTTAGVTSPARWSVSGGGTGSLTVDCTTGAYTVAGFPIILAGTSDDVSFARIGIFYDPALSPPSTLRCDTNAADPTGASPAC